MPKLSKLWFLGYDGLINEKKNGQRDLVVNDCANQEFDFDMCLFESEFIMMLEKNNLNSLPIYA